VARPLRRANRVDGRAAGATSVAAPNRTIAAQSSQWPGPMTPLLWSSSVAPSEMNCWRSGRRRTVLRCRRGYRSLPSANAAASRAESSGGGGIRTHGPPYGGPAGVGLAEREGFEPPGPSARAGCFQGSCNKPDSATAPSMSKSISVTDRRSARHSLIRYSEPFPSSTYSQS
jgi:hypothetical protein